MESILSYIYYGNISFENQENLLQLLEISIYFKLNLLKEIIQKKISNSINYSNFFQFLFQNRNLNSNEIEIKCFELINQNFSQIQNNENLFNLTKEEIIKFIQFKQEKKEIFQFDFFQFLNNWIKKRVKSLKLKKYKQKMNAKKRLFHSFFSLFDKDSISKQDFDKLKQFDIFLPNYFLIHFERTIFEIQDQENQTKIKENEKKIKRRDKRIKLFESETQNLKQENQKKEKDIQNLKSENQNQKQENENKEKKIKSFESETQNLKQENQKKEKENQNLKKENQKKEKDIQNLKSENEKKDKIIKQKDEEIQNLKLSFEKENQKEESKQNENKLLKIFSNSEIIKDIEYVKKLQEWINDNDFFSKMKKGFSAKRDGFDSQNWHKAVDDKGKTLVIIKTKDNFIFGGFTQVGWTNDKSKWSEEHDGGDYGYIKDENAFIFSLRNDKGDRKPEKFTIKQGQEQYAIEHDLKDGPTFGNFDFYLEDKLQPGYSDFGRSYNLPNGITYRTNEAQSYLAGSFKKWVVDELETYFI
ncbi:pep-cterm sorting domain-containing protein [Anaeramoeba ignava]|uniref:Pep-cterm sorting domain-containing protein n=1 Tax=Anaeramoeba ignava TaxID=1746090 RepID=A0A9Q0R8E0_ANAIG|nr:pep-cterm sorting domain-containing protein [Anaeramoeba ignava]